MIYSIADVLVIAIPIILAITLHEAAHAYVAVSLGDDLPLQQGRLTLNPIKHIDLFGTILLPLILFILGTGFLFGYAKPVRINALAFYNPKKTMIWVAIAGPLANLFIALTSTALALVLSSTHWVVGDFPVSGYLVRLCLASVAINIVLGILNLLPIPPLDGGRILTGLLPNSANKVIAQTSRFWLPMLVFIVFVLPILDKSGLNPFAILNIPVDYALHGIALMIAPPS